MASPHVVAVGRISPTRVVSPNIPSKTEFWQGYDMFTECAATGDYLSPEEYAAMADTERRGYETAARHQADTDTAEYLANYNAYGDRTDWGF